jgi:hypothetical protein
MCDQNLGKVLDMMDKYDLWEDTMLLVMTDHGLLLGEHGWWGKQVQPFFNEVIHTPLFIWDPRSGRSNERSDCLVQTIDFAPTLLEYFGVDVPKDMMGVPLKKTMAFDTPVREAALFGVFGGHINCTDGRYVYMRGAQNDDNQPLHHYTLMPMHMRRLFTPEELQTAEFVEAFSFTKGCKTLQVKWGIWDKRNPYTQSGYVKPADLTKNFLFDLQHDPNQENSIENQLIEEQMIAHLLRLMQESDTPLEQYERVGLQ